MLGCAGASPHPSRRDGQPHSGRSGWTNALPTRISRTRAPCPALATLSDGRQWPPGLANATHASVCQGDGGQPAIRSPQSRLAGSTGATRTLSRRDGQTIAPVALAGRERAPRSSPRSPMATEGLRSPLMRTREAFVREMTDGLPYARPSRVWHAPTAAAPRPSQPRSLAAGQPQYRRGAPNPDPAPNRTRATPTAASARPGDCCGCGRYPTDHSSQPRKATAAAPTMPRMR